jgi:long-subunit acyl-CoA synthetase (AMP-forming)
MRRKRYEALIRLGVHYAEQHDDAMRHAYEARDERDEFGYREHQKEMSRFASKLEALGEAAPEVFGESYDSFMARVGDAKMKNKSSQEVSS